jgi:hypothetical protein
MILGIDFESDDRFATMLLVMGRSVRLGDVS